MANKNHYLCVLIMGLPGSGKTTVAKILSKQLKAVFIEGDDHHSKQILDFTPPRLARPSKVPCRARGGPCHSGPISPRAVCLWHLQICC